MAKTQRILVTGGAGFLGSHLCERLVARRARRDLPGQFLHQPEVQRRAPARSGNFELIRHDITQPIWLEVDEIYNLACPAAPGHYQYNPIKTMKTSVMGAINVLGMAKRCRAKVLQASTSEVYGDPEVHPQPESYRGSVNPIGPRACYDEGKRAAETLFMDYHRMNGVQHSHRADLQHLRPADASLRRPRRLQLHPPGAGGRGHHDLRRRLADAFVLLSRRSGRGHDSHDEWMPTISRRPGESRQPGRVHDSPAGRTGAGVDRLDVEAGYSPAAGGRSDAPPARHHAGAAAS